MIQSINKEIIDADQLNIYIEEMEKREELLCFLAACAGAAEPCVVQACAVACFGISACFVGAHTI